MNFAKLKFNKALLLVFISAIAIIVDQVTKNLATLYLKNKESIKIIDNVLELSYVENEGAAFGMLKGHYNFFFIFTIVVVALLLYIYFKLPLNKHYKLINILIIMIIAGAIGNFIDRTLYKYVVDFIYVKCIDFPVFNMADSYITVASFAMLISLFTIYKDEKWLK